MDGEGLGVDINGVDDAALLGVVARLPAGAGPGLLLRVNLVVDHLGHLDRLHHLGDDAVSEEEDRHAVLFCLVKGKHHDVDGFLNGRRGIGQQVVVAVAAALDALEVVALRGLDVAEAGAAAHDVQDNAGELCTRAVADAFLLQADAGAGGRGDDACAGAGSAVYHIDCRNFAFRLEEASSDFGHTGGHVLGDFSLRGNGIAEEKACAGTNGGLCDRFASLHQSQCHILFPPSQSFSIRMATSGQVLAQDAHPMQSSGLANSAG